MADTLRSQLEAGPRDSLLDVILNRVQKSGKTVLTTRIVYVARLAQRQNSSDSVRALLSRVIEKHSSVEGEITGFLLVYPLCYIHVIEGKTPQLMAVLREVLNHGADVRLAETRVVSSCEDVPGRHFNGWYVAYLPSGSTVESMDPLDAFGAVKGATDINTFLRKAGPELLAPMDPETRRKLSNVDASLEDVPAQELVLSLTPTEDAPTVAEYLDIFDAPVNVDLESEQVWPMPPPLKY
ncbi:hypothetical protein CHLRE_01g038750v5 [Chlamydomonas reinhardtii]|uniref:Inner-arm dynein f/I1 light chain n=1 Tax=Chlamydomonas reinhardtii TaxID=3055 RepID=A0A2K3E783_CHLRE|nr:uncharacterized protein CHLRE_01g038750v5 [Chlamydomonas reinhardtii]PNW88650.1 hypothetical protein CHLRE_01g038750v5 [Chlamydomonas reinhardtii]8GLV_D9 Chain D9, Inner-arm dynein f/I1 light chain [Chlamydomonas reinhardtii]BBJ36797.1 inner-arm dynein f/I1 light chain [Chlamydomonas reinhardtii]